MSIMIASGNGCVNTVFTDEMNIFLPQSIQTQIELEEIADVKRQIITPSSSTTIIGIVQDGLLGSYNLTAPTMRIDWKSAMNIMSYTSIDDFSSFKKKGDFTGHELFSMIIPENINMSKYKGNKPSIVIENGKMIEGRLNKDLLGPKKKNNIIQTIWDEYGVDETKTFLDDTQKLVNNFNLYNGFTIGIGDITPAPEIKKEIYKIFSNKDVKIAHMITEIENNPDLMSAELFERTLQSELNVVREDVSKLLIKNISDTNKLNIMASSGSKGNQTNFGQMCGCVGLMSVGGKLIEKKVQNRSLPYFHENDDTSSARGLVKRSFLEGIKYSEYIYSAIAGREGVIDTALKTAVSGYAQRRLVKILEDAMVTYDGTVRSATQHILQFVYGNSGADTTKQYDHTIKMLCMGNSELRTKYVFSDSELKKINGYSVNENEEYLNMLIEMRNMLRTTQIKSNMDYITISSSFMIPVNLQRIVNNSIIMATSNTKNDLSPKYIISEIERALDCTNTVVMCMHKNDKSNPNSVKYKDDKICKTVLRIAMYEILAPKKCIVEYGFNKQIFDKTISDIINGYNKNIIEAGSMVGLIAAQSMGECLTQMTLNTFHSAGLSAIATTTSGIPRIIELMSLAKAIKTPQMILYLKKEHMDNRGMVNRIAAYVNHVTIGSLRQDIQCIYDPNPSKPDGYREKDNIVGSFYSQSKNGCQADFENLPWLFRIVMDKEKMLEKEVTLLDIKSNFCNSWEKWNTDPKSLKKEEKAIIEKVSSCSISSSSDNDDKQIIHIRINMSDVNIEKLNTFSEMFIDNFKLKGLANVNEGIINEERTLVFDGEDEAEEKKTQYAIYTDGVNLTDIRYIVGIDLHKTVCNDVSEVYKAFGIEAARSVLVREFISAYERSGNTVNVQHIEMLADVMTFNGFMVSIDRHGMTKSTNGPLSKASFENTMDHFITAAVFNESDNMKGISARIMAGMAFEGGTGLCKLILDTDMLEKSEYTDDISQKYDKSYNDIKQSSEIQDIIEGDNEDMFIPM